MFPRSKIVVPHWGEPIVGKHRYMSNKGPSEITAATAQSRWGSGTEATGAVFHDVTFSSSAGFLASIDDFYITSGGYGDLMVTETSLDIYAPGLVEKIHPESLLCWMRVTVANRMSDTGPDWSWWFSVFHSGTYVNQWMVIDMRLFTPYQKPLTANLLTVLEEMPGFVHSEDQTAHLEVCACLPACLLAVYILA